jgi:hypothetical protein
VHWSTHKPICKAARRQRKDASKEIKKAKHDMEAIRIANVEMQRVTSSKVIMDPPPTNEEKSEAKKMVGFLFDLHGNQLDNLYKVNLFTKLDENPRLWDTCLTETPDFLENIAQWIIKSDSINEPKKWKPPSGNPQLHPTVAEWFCTYLLRGMTTGNTMSFSGCNAQRAHAFFVQTENGWNAIVASVLGSLRKLTHPKVSSSVRGIYDGNVRGMLRFLTGGVLVNSDVGSAIVRDRLTALSQKMLKEMMDIVGDPRNARYDPGSAIEGLVNQTVALVHVWTEQLQVREEFFPSLKLDDDRLVMYKVMAYRMAVVMVDKGRNCNPEEVQTLHLTTNSEMERLMMETSRGERKKKKKGKKGKKGKRR